MTSRVFAQSVLDAIYDGPLAEDAHYVVPGAPAPEVPCRIKIASGEAGLDLGTFASRPISGSGTVKVRFSELPDVNIGGTFIVSDTNGEPLTVYQVISVPERFDALRLEWTCEISSGARRGS